MHHAFIDEVGGDWSRESAGRYIYTSEDPFDIDNVYIPSYINGNSGGMYTDYNGVLRQLFVSDGTIRLEVNENGIASDGFINNFPIEFEIYP